MPAIADPPATDQEDIMIKLFASIALAAAALAGAPAFADAPAAPTWRVAVADLDLASPAGVRALDARLAAAVRRVCPVPLTPSAHTAADQRACLAVATDAADRGRTRVLAQAGLARVQLATR